MTMLEKAIAIMNKGRTDQCDQVWTLNELRRETGIALRSQYRLSEQLRSDPRVEHVGGNRYKRGEQ